MEDFERGQYARSFGYYATVAAAAGDDDRPRPTTETETTPTRRCRTRRRASRPPPRHRRRRRPRRPRRPPPSAAAADGAAAAPTEPPPPPPTDRPRLDEPRRAARGGAVALLVAGCVACAWIERAPLVPANAGRAGGGRLGMVFLALLAAAFAVYLGALALLRRRPPGSAGCARRRVRDPARAARRAAPALDRRLDVLGVRPHRGRPRRQPLRRRAERLSGRPVLRVRRRGLARHDVRLRAGVHAALRAVALVSGSSAEAAAWIFKTIAALAVLACVLARRAACTRPALRRGARRLEPALRHPLRRRRPQRRAHGRRSSSARSRSPARGAASLAALAWVVAVLVKWIPLLFFALRALEARATGRRVSHRGFAVAAAVLVALATWRYGLDWLARVRPARAQRGGADELRAPAPGRAARRSPRGRARRWRGSRSSAGSRGWRARRRGRARLGLAACLLLATTPVARALVHDLGASARRGGGRPPGAAGLARLLRVLLPQTIPL